MSKPRPAPSHRLTCSVVRFVVEFPRSLRPRLVIELREGLSPLLEDRFTIPLAADLIATARQHLARRLERNRRGTPGRGCGFCTTARFTIGPSAGPGLRGSAQFHPSLTEASHSFPRSAHARFTLPFDFVERLRNAKEPMQSPKRRTDLRGNEGWSNAHHGVITPALRNP